MNEYESWVGPQVGRCLKPSPATYQPCDSVTLGKVFTLYPCNLGVHFCLSVVTNIT